MFFGTRSISWPLLIFTILIIDMGIDIHLISKYQIKDDQVSIQARVYKSCLRNLVTSDQAKKFYQSAPVLTSFIVGMDPRASKYAQYRWVFLVTIGWMQFCLLSPWGSRIISHDPGMTRFHLLAFPFAILVFYYPFRIIARLVIRSNWLAGIVWTVMFKSLAGILCTLLVVVSLLSPIATVAYIIWKLGRFTFRTGTRISFGLYKTVEKLLGSPTTGFIPAIHNWAKRNTKGNGDKDFNLIPRRAELPGPIVRRVEIGGIRYDV